MALFQKMLNELTNSIVSLKENKKQQMRVKGARILFLFELREAIDFVDSPVFFI
jgi:hypothetical protein